MPCCLLLIIAPRRHPRIYVALKCKTASASEDSQETYILRRLESSVPEYVAVPSGYDRLPGPNGVHDVYLFKDVGSSLSCVPKDHLLRGTLKNETVYRYPLQVAKSIVKQVLEGLKEVHILGIVHNDLKIANILVVAETVPELDVGEVATDRQDRIHLTNASITEGGRPRQISHASNFVEDAAIDVTMDSTFKIIDISEGKTCTFMVPVQLASW
jgi:serine/threonine protein kinase